MENKPKMDGLVIGLVGQKAAGKDVLCDYLKTKGFDVRRLSDAVRHDCAQSGFDNPTVKQMQDVADGQRRKYGSGYYAGKALEMAEQAGSRLIVVNGIRNPGEVETLRELGPLTRHEVVARYPVEGQMRTMYRMDVRFFSLVGIVAPIMTRAERFMKRGQAGDPKGLEEFLRMDDRDRGIGQPADGQQVDRCLAMVPWENMYCNTGTLEEYYRWIDALLGRYLLDARE